MPSLPVVGGDAAAACIAAASVLAKVSRDRLMVSMDRDLPGYGFADHKGYSTPAHTAALAELGPSDQHRYSFINVRRLAPAIPVAVVHTSTEPGRHADAAWGKMDQEPWMSGCVGQTPADLHEGQQSR
jgi:ribonuclease HII